MAKSRKPKVSKEDKVIAKFLTTIDVIKAHLESIRSDAGDNEKILARIVKLSVTSGKIAVAAKTIDEREAKKEARETKKAERKAERKEKLQAQLEAVQAKLEALEN